MSALTILMDKYQKSVINPTKSPVEETYQKPSIIFINRKLNITRAICPNCNSYIEFKANDYDNHEICCCPKCDVELKLN